MPFVITADQLGSRRTTDLVASTVSALAGVPTRLPFTRTVGDELQGLLTEPVSVVDAILILMRNERWHIGLGIGPVEEPLPAAAPAARGAAFVCARAAVERAKTDPSHLAVVPAADPQQFAADAEAVLRLLAAVHRHRTEAGWEAVDEVRRGRNQLQAAAALDVSRQAVGQRLKAAEWAAESSAIPTLTRLLERAETSATA
jgi:hypothetical protein